MIGKITFIFRIKSVEWIAKNYTDFYFINKQILVIHSLIHSYILWILTGVIKLKKSYKKIFTQLPQVV